MVVEKVVMEVGFLEFLCGKEEEEGGVEVVLLLEMEEEMEGRMMEELVEMVVEEMEKGGLPKESTVAWGCHFVLCWLLLEKKEERKMKEKERKGGVYIKGGK